MALSNSALWSRIERAEIDPRWIERLAIDQGWSAADTDRVAREYRRFVYLAQRIDLPPAPPAPIDAAWSTHLLFTRDYWERFVPETLRTPFHRDAVRCADTEARRAFHKAVLAAYLGEFGETAPPDIWPRPDRMEWGAWVAVLMIFGVGGGFVAFFAMYLLGWIAGQPIGGPVDTTFEKIGASIFLLCWGAAFFSPLWAWLLTRTQKRLKTSKRADDYSGFSVGLSVGRGTD